MKPVLFAAAAALAVGASADNVRPLYPKPPYAMYPSGGYPHHRPTGGHTTKTISTEIPPYPTATDTVIYVSVPVEQPTTHTVTETTTVTIREGGCKPVTTSTHTDRHFEPPHSETSSLPYYPTPSSLPPYPTESHTHTRHHPTGGYHPSGGYFSYPTFAPTPSAYAQVAKLARRDNPAPVKPYAVPNEDTLKGGPGFPTYETGSGAEALSAKAVLSGIAALAAIVAVLA